MKKSGSFVKNGNVSLPFVGEGKKGEKEKEKEAEKKVTEDEFGGKFEPPYDRIGRWGWGA